ncbi:MAG: SGNH/GDSL hydrolase family protein [Deltaproteobacteria bacterium]|nr:SGNH/GDSL hydrolase family protein [Deltaproteobacteria bacterium]
MRANIEFRWIVDGRSTTYRANKQGFRGDSDFSETASHKTIILVGDSFTFGAGVELEETFGALMKNLLEDGVTVYNFAMPGFGLDQMWMSVKHQALPMKPTLIIVAFVDEDLDRSLTAYRHVEGFNKPIFEIENGVLRPQNGGDKPHGLIRYFETHSAVWNLLRKFFSPRAYGVPFGDWWRRNEAIFKAMIEDSWSSDCHIIFVRLPMKTPREFLNLRRLMTSQGANFLDLGTSKMRPSYEIHFRDDGHMNEAGHKFVAELLVDWIRRNLPKWAVQRN